MVGDAEGDFVGFFTGPRLGLKLETTGLTLGESVGLRVGDVVGFGVGAEEVEGLNDKVVVGIGVDGVGTLERVGDVEGPSVVGDIVGLSVVGFSDGGQVVNGVGALDHVGDCVGMACAQFVMS